MQLDEGYLDPSLSRAVLIGTSRYDVKGYRQLKGVRNNVHDLARILRDPGVWGLPKEHCVIVEDPESSKEILDSIRVAASAATGTLLVYYAGHGFEGLHDQELYMTHSGSAENEPTTALSYSLVREVVRNAPAENRLVILDCCQAGFAIPVMGRAKVVIDRTFVMCAVGRYREAEAKNGCHNTTYTAALIRAMSDGGLHLPERLAPEDLHKLVETNLVSRNKPKPVCALTGNSPNLPLFRNQAFVSTPSPHQPRWVSRHNPEILLAASAVGVVGALSATGAAMPAYMSAVAAFAGALTTIVVAAILRRRTKNAR